MRIAPLLLMVLALAGCGGGGTAPAAAPPPPWAGGTASLLTVDLDGALSSALLFGQVSSRGTLVGGTGVELEIAWQGTCLREGSPACTQTLLWEQFDGKRLARADEIRRTSPDGGLPPPFPAGRTSRFFSQDHIVAPQLLADPLDIHGERDPEGRISVTLTAQPLPKAAAIGDEGLFRTFITYTDASKSVVHATGTQTWFVAADTARTVLGCLRTSMAAADGTATSATECVPIYRGIVNGRGLRALYEGGGRRLAFAAPTVPEPRPRTPSTITIDFDAAMEDAFTAGKVLDVPALLEDLSLQLNWVHGSFAGAESFEGALRQASDFTWSEQRQGAVTVAGARHFFSTRPFTIHGHAGRDGSHAVTTASAALPTAGKLGDTGLFRTYTTYANAAKATVLSTTTVSWSLEANTSRSLLGCFLAVTRPVGGGERRLSACFPIGADSRIDGTPGRARVVRSDAGTVEIFE